MNLLFGHDMAVAEWVGKLNGKPFVLFDRAFGLVDADGRLRGGYVFTGYNGDSIELSLAGSAAASRSGMSAVLSYVFDQLQCSRLQMHTRKSNKRTLRQLYRLGLGYEGVAKRFYGREHGVCYALTVDDLPKFKARWRL